MDVLTEGYALPVSGGLYPPPPYLYRGATAIIAPEISPPGRFAQRNSRPPAAPIASVSIALRSLARSGRTRLRDAANCLTPPYGKSACDRQLR